jgi:hypothetical protein
MGEWRYSSTILDLGIDGEKWSASRHGRLTQAERGPGTYGIAGLVSPRVGLDTVKERTIFTPPGIEPRFRKMLKCDTFI